MSIKRKKLQIGDLVTYDGPNAQKPGYPVNMGVGIVLDINGYVSVYWPLPWGSPDPGIHLHHFRYLKKFIYRE